MLTAKQNFLETIKPGGKPDRLVKQFEGTVFLPGDPVNYFVRGERFPGMPPKTDRWGTTIIWEQGTPGAMPHVTEDNKVVRDITHWRDFTRVPDLIANCSDSALWEPYLERAAAIDRGENLLMMFAPTGVFERLHFLMGFEDTFVNLMTEPEAMEDLCAAIGEYRYNGFKLMTDYVRPDIILSHDDWGSKTNLFMQPELWREYIKANFQRSYDYLHENGVIIMHHCDSFCEPIIEDMVDLHIDVWQGVLPQNDIPKLQKQLAGRMTLMGGIDAAVVDRSDSTEAEIRAETRRACVAYAPGGHFIPCITYGGPGCIYPHADAIIDAEIERFNTEHF
ncbi:MAG: uroporphyrinogen decarboxylase (URO-D) [Oscillospiraceae bacterium]|jgi:hypothetical protein|nr:uroporphyrinogen decarboxylase (URO-D) [Oscillospiraceae bacterium]